MVVMRESGEHAPGTILLGKLEVIRRLGGGGMGDVYEVEHRLTGHRRALKLVRARYADRPRFMKRLLREAKVAGTLDTPYVVETYDAGRLEDGSAYVLMELLEGQSLYEVMQASGTIEPARLANIMAQVAEGMTLAHGAGIIHRDLKPENIFVGNDEQGHERVKILDFGVSKFELSEKASRLTAEGTLVGTPYYMSPEQASGRSVDARTDVYAMGVMLYEGLVGKLPFEASTVGELFIRIGAGECVPLQIRRPDLDPTWHEVTHKAFHRDRKKRYQTSEELRRALLPLAPAQTTKRAKTISDGSATRATIGYDEPAVPRPPKTPSDDASGVDIPVAPARSQASAPPSPDDDSGPVKAAPPPAAPQPRSMAGWIWAIGILSVAVGILLPWRLLQGRSDPAAPATQVQPLPDQTQEAPLEPVGPASDESEPAAPVAELTPDAGIEDLPPADPSTSGSSAVPSRPRPPTRATAAGLDPNPYR